jgi:DNA polymerase I-like protein with 3'-5' exonuclease and polymerase domains
VISNNVILDADRLQREVDYIREQDAFVFDVEADGKYRRVPLKCNVTWIGLATYGRTVVVPLGHPIGDNIIGEKKEPRTDKNGKIRFYKTPVWDEPPIQLRPSQAWDILKPLFLDPYIIKGAFNATYDNVAVVKYIGQAPVPPFTDPIVSQWLLNENIKSKGLKDLVKRYYGLDYDQENIGKQVEKFPFSKVARYNYLDAKYTWLLRNRFLPLIEEDGIENVHRLESDLIEVLVDMRITGAPIDMTRLGELETVLSEKLVGLEAQLYRAAGKRFNIGSVKQKQEILYLPKSKGGQGLRGKVLTEGGESRKKRGDKLTHYDFSTSSEALAPYQNNPVVGSLGEYQDVSKLLNTYVRSYLGNEAEGKLPVVLDGRLHAEFVQYGTVSGRFSCREPNLQNIPTRTEAGKLIRELFVADPGYKLLIADYDQIELRIMAHYAKPGRLLDGFLQGIDPHTTTASAIFGVAPEDVTSEMRGVGKGINFAIGYGAGDETVAGMAHISVKDATRFGKLHEREFPEIYELKDRVIETCRSRRPPHIRTLLGRKRRLPTIFAQSTGVRKKAERQAFNSLIQGGQADLIKLAMIRLHRRLPEVPGMKMILTVHDELGSLCPADLVDDGKRILQEAMLGEGIQKYLKVKLAADVKSVDRWSEAK